MCVLCSSGLTVWRSPRIDAKWNDMGYPPDHIFPELCVMASDDEYHFIDVWPSHTYSFKDRSLPAWELQRIALSGPLSRNWIHLGKATHLHSGGSTTYINFVISELPPPLFVFGKYIKMESGPWSIDFAQSSIIYSAMSKASIQDLMYW